MQTTNLANNLFGADMLSGYMLAVFMALFSALKIKTSFLKSKIILCLVFLFFLEQIS
jgi:hypothetical protein